MIPVAVLFEVVELLEEGGEVREGDGERDEDGVVVVLLFFAVESHRAKGLLFLEVEEGVFAVEGVEERGLVRRGVPHYGWLNSNLSLAIYRSNLPIR